jgi:hypothetical protein
VGENKKKKLNKTTATKTRKTEKGESRPPRNQIVTMSFFEPNNLKEN